MKYLLVDRGDNIVDRVDLESGVGTNGAKTFFIGRKKIDEKEFDNMWKVMSKETYDIQFAASLQNRQMGKMKYKWWKDDESYLDIDK